MSTINLGVKLPGSGYPNITEFIVENIFAGLPYKTGLVGAYFLSSKGISPLVNYADLNKPLLRVGNPTVGEKYTIIDQQNYYDTGLSSTPNMTIIGVSFPITGQSNGDVVASNLIRDSSGNLKGDALRVNCDGNSSNVTAYGDFSASLPISAIINANNFDLPIGVPLITYSIITNSKGNSQSVRVAYFNERDNAGVIYPQTPSATNSGDVQTDRRITSGNTILLGATRSSTDLPGKSQVSIVLLFDGNAVPGLIDNSKWLKETFGLQYGPWS